MLCFTWNEGQFQARLHDRDHVLETGQVAGGGPDARAQQQGLWRSAQPVEQGAHHHVGGTVVGVTVVEERQDLLHQTRALLQLLVAVNH